jgi:hypothetical protein
MDKFKAGDVVVCEGHGRAFTVVEVEGRFVRLEGDAPDYWTCASALRPFIAPTA